MFQRVMFGPLDKEENKKLTDLTPREIVVFVPLLIMMFVMGIYPKPFLSRMEPSVEAFVQRVEPYLEPRESYQHHPASTAPESHKGPETSNVESETLHSKPHADGGAH
jgi:NADH-quinone oxidoreductase subunit M